MLISIVMIAAITFSGLALTYLVADDEPFMWRLSVGSVVGSAVFGLTAFVVASLLGFNTATVAVSLAITALPLALLRKAGIRRIFLHDWTKAKGKLQGATAKKFVRFVYYLFFFVLFWFFFQQTMFETNDGIFTGGSQNLGDLPFHLGAIFSFTDGNNFPPQNPSWAGAKFSYPFIADFLTACFVKLGADVRGAMFVQNVAWAFSLLVILERFVAKLTNNKLAGRLAPALLFFSGGLGFVWFFKDSWESGKGFLDFLWHLPRDYTIGDQFRWGNSMVVLFMTQRSLLLGMPWTIVVLGYLWKIFATESTENTEKEDSERARGRDAGEKNFVAASPRHSVTASVLVGLLAGMLPLIHLHSLVVLFVVTVFLFALRPAKWREWIAFGVGVAVIAVPELVWSMSGSATETSKFIDWHFGWDKRQDNFLWFWVKNTGIVIPILVAGVYVFWAKGTRDKGQGENPNPDSSLIPYPSSLLLFYLPFVCLFIVSNAAKLAPWEWDNIKILIYWFVGSVPLIALALAWMWERDRVFKAIAATCVVVLVFSGALDVWRTMSGQIKYRLFDSDAMKIAEQIKQITASGALFVNAPTYNSAVVLSGRQSLMRYSGHLSSHGIDYAPRENDVRRIYEGGGVADILLRKYNIDYVLVSPEERNSLKANEDFFKKYTVVAEAGLYRVYKVK